MAVKSVERPFENEDALEESLSRPTEGVIETIRKFKGDVAILGVGGKMGPTLAMMVRRAMDKLNRKDRVLGVGRSFKPEMKALLKRHSIVPVVCDLLDRNQVKKLPDAANVIFMAGMKFGTSSGPELTWVMNTLVPEHACERYAKSRIVAFSTGCVYPLYPVKEGGSSESVEVGPPGDYANSCVGRERIFTYFSRKNGTPVSIFRLNYAVDLRYGVLLDIATKIWNDEPMDVTMGYVNLIWQGEANARAIQCLDHASTPPFIVNVTGVKINAVRDIVAGFGKRFGKKARTVGREAPTAWVINAGKSVKLFGKPEVSLEQMMDWTAEWVRRGSRTLGKPTHFETRDGKF